MREAIHIHYSNGFYLGNLPVFETEVMVSSMPKGKWELPKTPYNFPNTLTNNDTESFHSVCREVLKKWVPFFDGAEKGCNIVKKAYEHNKLEYDLPSISKFRYFYVAFQTKFKEKYGEPSFKDIKETIASCRKPFIFLLTDKQAKDFGHKKQSEISKEDISNAKYLLNYIYNSYK